MRTQKQEKVIAMWGYCAENGYDGFDWIDVESVAALCEDANGNLHLYLDCSYDKNDDELLVNSFNVGFNPLFNMMGLNECVEDLLCEYCLAMELELYDREKYKDELDELEIWEVNSNVLKHMRSVVSLECDYLIHEYPPNEGVPFRVWIHKYF